MYIEQDGYDTYFKYNRHDTDMDTTDIEAYLSNVHLPRGYSHYDISSRHKYQDDAMGRMQTWLFVERI